MNVWLKSQQEHCDAINLAWAKILKVHFQHHGKSTLKRIQVVLEAKGGSYPVRDKYI